MLKELEHPAKALASFDRALAIKPDYAEALYNRGNVLLDMKCIDEALVSFNRTIAIEPDHAQAHYNRGNVLSDLRRWLLDRDDSPWYPEMRLRLIRQQTRGDWSTVFRDMAVELDSILARNRHTDAPVTATS